MVDEFRREHLVDRATAAFFYHQQRSLIHAGRKGIDDGGHGGHGDRRSDGGSFESWYAHTLGAHTLGRRANIHGERDVLKALEERFVTRRLSYGPYLFRHGLDAAVEPLERMLIAEGGIRATGLRWVGALEAEPPGQGC